MHIDALLLSRFQFAWVIALHILLPAFTVGLSCFIATLELLLVDHPRDVYRPAFGFLAQDFRGVVRDGRRIGDRDAVPVRHQLEPFHRRPRERDRPA